METWNIFLVQLLSTNKSLSDNTKTRFAVSLAEYSYENIPLTEMLCSIKVTKKHVHAYCLNGKHFMCWDLHGMLETDNFVQKDSKHTIKTIKNFRNHHNARVLHVIRLVHILTKNPVHGKTCMVLSGLLSSSL